MAEIRTFPAAARQSISVLAWLEPTDNVTSSREPAMLFMIIERFKNNDMVPIYKRVRDEGRVIPDGLEYVDSWIEPNFSRCFQLMKCDDLRLLQEWILNWRGYGVEFEIVPVVSSKETRDVVEPCLNGS
jgi:hypothetical protein